MEPSSLGGNVNEYGGGFSSAGGTNSASQTHGFVAAVPGDCYHIRMVDATHTGGSWLVEKQTVTHHGEVKTRRVAIKQLLQKERLKISADL